MSWREVKPGERRWSIGMRREDGHAVFQTSRMGTSVEEVRAQVEAEYPGWKAGTVEPMFQKGDPK